MPIRIYVIMFPAQKSVTFLFKKTKYSFYDMHEKKERKRNKRCENGTLM